MDYFSLPTQPGPCSGLGAVATSPSASSPVGSVPSPKSPMGSPRAMALIRRMRSANTKSATTSGSGPSASPSVTSAGPSACSTGQVDSRQVSRSQRPSPASSMSNLRSPARNRSRPSSTAPPAAGSGVSKTTMPTKMPVKMAGSGLAVRRGIAWMAQCPVPLREEIDMSRLGSFFLASLQSAIGCQAQWRTKSKAEATDAVRLPAVLLPPSCSSSGSSGSSTGLPTPQESEGSLGAQTPPPLEATTAAIVATAATTEAALLSASIWKTLPAWLLAAASGDYGLDGVVGRFNRICCREDQRIRNALCNGCCPIVQKRLRLRKLVAQQKPGRPGRPKKPAGSMHSRVGDGKTPLHNVFVPFPDIHLAGFEVGMKNRFKNVWPFDHTRVLIPPAPVTEVSCGFVNASYVGLECDCTTRQYVASQAPTRQSVGDFWSMASNEASRVIVMLTPEMENTGRKSEPYWRSGRYGDFTVTNLGEAIVRLDREEIDRISRGGVEALGLSKSKSFVVRSTGYGFPSLGSSDGNPDEYFDRPGSNGASPSVPVVEYDEAMNATVRHIELRKVGSDHVQTLFQMHYSGWPDLAAPANPTEVVALVRLVRLLDRFITPDGEEPIPMLVHCAAGCGRTGTFCALDSILDVLLQGEVANLGMRDRQDPDWTDKLVARWGVPYDHTVENTCRTKPTADSKSTAPVWTTDLIEMTVETLRRQRMSMVQTPRQFLLCYEVVLEALVQELKM